MGVELTEKKMSEPKELKLNVYVGADHRGVEFKARIVDIVTKLGFYVEDKGTNTQESCDYPRVAFDVAKAVVASQDNRGILVCWSGIGQAIAANKVDGALAALCYNSEAAELSRLHNNANILVLSAKFTPDDELATIIETWLKTEFEGGRHKRRVDLIREIESGKDIGTHD